MDEQIRAAERLFLSTGTYESALNYARKLRRAGVMTLEITDNWPRMIISIFWPRVTYEGHEIISLIRYLDQELRPTEGHGYLYQYGDSQECYLGWLSSSDRLVIGWDAWTEDEGDFGDYSEEPGSQFYGVSRTVSVSFSETLPLTRIQAHGSHEEPGGFYRGLYPILKSEYPDLVDLRLD